MNLKKLGTLVIAIIMTMTVGLAFATSPDMDGEAGRIGEFDSTATPAESPTLVGDSVIIYKELTAFNPSASKINAPTISYAYSIATGSKDKKITDAAGVEVLTYAGVGQPTITSTVAWSPADELDASAGGTVNRKPITIDFTGITFPRAGVYRYEITETITDAAYTAAGVVNGGISNKRYLDVYVKDDGIYGYVLMDADNDGVTDNTAKTEGFVATDSQTADQYHTFNLTISKTVANDAYIQTNGHQFPFTVTFTNATVTGAVKPIITTTAPATLAQADAAAIASFAATNPKIGHNGSVVYTGIPMGTSVTIVEQNDVAGTTYAVTTTGADTNIETAEAVTSGNSTTGTIAVNAQTAGSEADKTVAVTNDMKIISPTGVVLRVAPYILMLAAGIALLVIGLKRRSSKEEA